MKMMIGLAFCVLCVGAYALTPAEQKDFAARTVDPNPAVRLAAMDKLSQLAEQNPEKVGVEAVAIFCAGLKDDDRAVRENAAADLAILAMQTFPRVNGGKAGHLDIRSYEPLRGDLEAAMFDADPEVRRAASGAYFFTFDLPSDLQAKLVAQYPKEEGSGRQGAIVEELASCGSPTASTQRFLTDLLSDPKGRRFVITAYQKLPLLPKEAPPPLAALPMLAEMLLTEPNTEKRQSLARVIRRYGKQARSYLARIEQLRDKETDPVTKANLASTAEAIRSGTPPKE